MGRPFLLLVILSVLLLVPRTAAPGTAPVPQPYTALAEAKHLSVYTGNPYLRDRPLLATVSPNGDGYRDFAYVRFHLTAPARVTIHAQATDRTFQGVTQPTWIVRRRMEQGWQTVAWRPSLSLEPTTYVIVVIVTSQGQSIVYGRLTRDSNTRPGPVVRVLGVDAAFDRSSYAPGDTAQLTVASDAVGLTLRIVDVAGTDIQPTEAGLTGPDVIEPKHYPWDANRDHAVTLPVEIGDWRPGVYFAVVQNGAGNVGYAPFIVKEAHPTSRVAVLMSDQTWFAYDFYDADHDGFPDSWYDGGPDVVQLARPFAHNGVPWLFGSQAWPFLRWARLHDAEVDFLAEADVVALGSELAKDFDLIVVPTHLEYVTEAEYDALQAYRDAGGDLIFLASNDVYWKVEIDGTTMHRVARWRELGRPESALVGGQYAGSKTNDVAPYVLADTSATPWAFAGTGLVPGDLFSYAGNEFDVKTAASPADTQVLATVHTPLHRGDMTYYELNGAKVFDPGTYLAGRVLQKDESRFLENLWNNSDAPDLPSPPG